MPPQFGGSGGWRSKVTVVLLTHNAAPWLADTLARLRALQVSALAVDNASTDDTVAMLRDEPQIQVVALPENIGAAARNVGLQRCTTPYIAFCDDDVWYEMDGLERAVEVLAAHTDVALVNAQVLVGRREGPDPESVQMRTSPLPPVTGLPGRPLLNFIAGASVMRKSAFRQAGGFDEHSFLGHEEEELAIQLAQRGWHMQYLDDVRVHHLDHGRNTNRLRRWSVRNTLLTAWRHRRLWSAIRWTVKVARTSPSVWQFFLGFCMAVALAPGLLRRRRKLPAELASRLDLLDRHRRVMRQPRRPKIRTRHHGHRRLR